MREICEEYDPQVLRYFTLTAHYRSPLNFSREIMESSKNALERILTGAEALRDTAAKGGEMTDAEKEKLPKLSEIRTKFEAAMEDDINTADAIAAWKPDAVIIAAVFELVKTGNTEVKDGCSGAFAAEMLAELDELCGILGLKTERAKEDLDAQVEAMIAERQAARKAKDFAKADAIRAQLLEMGIILEDTREGVKWKKA